MAGLPDGWWSVEREVVRLLSFGSGEYETELAVTIHPPRTAQARVGRWEFQVVASAVAQTLEARAPASVDVQPFQAIKLAARPPVAFGRRRALVYAEVSNVGNAPVAVDVEASELEDRCTFVLPVMRAGILPGQAASIPIGVKPRRPHVLGRKADRPLQLRTWTAGDEPGPVASDSAIFRQRPWIPWWAALLVVLLLIAALLVFLLWPDRVTVPDVQGMPSAFAAQERLEQEELTVSPDSKTEVRTDVEPGIVIGQTPVPGSEVDPGDVVTLLLARGSRRTRVPDVKGLAPGEAEQRLVAARLTLGTVSPQLDPKGTIASQVPVPGRTRRRGTAVNVVLAGTKVKVPKLDDLTLVKAEQRLAKAGLVLGRISPRPNPNRPIVSQVPAAGAQRPAGSRVDVFLKQPKPRPQQDEDGQGGGNQGKGGDGQGGNQDQGAGDPGGQGATVPATGGQGAIAATAAVKAAGLQPRTQLAIDESVAGTIVRTVPAAGDRSPSGGRVRIVVSAGFPRLAYDVGADVLTAAGATGGAVEPVLRREAAETAPAWIPGGRAVVLRSEGGLVVTGTGSPRRPVRLALGGAGEDLDEPSVASSGPRTALAFVSHRLWTGDQLCFAELSGRAAGTPSCRRLGDWRLGELTWMPGGHTLLAAAEPLDTTDRRFGLLRLTTDTPFSTSAADWRGGHSLVTPARPGRGVAAAAVAPSGRRLAVVTNHPTGGFRIAITAADDLALEHARSLPLQGCDVAWRPDGQELAVVQSDDACIQPLGRVVRVSPARPRELKTVVLRGRDPAWQPVELGPVSPARAPALGTRP